MTMAYSATLPDTEPPVRVKFRVVLLSIVGLWACYFVLVSLRAALGLELQYELLWRRAVVTLAGIGITLVFWLVLRLFDRRTLIVQIIAALLLAIPASIVIATVNQQIFASVQDDVEAAMAEKRGFQVRKDGQGNKIIEARPATSPDVDGPLGPDATVRGRIVVPAGMDDEDRWQSVLEIALGRYFLLFAWGSLYFALVAIERARLAERREARFRSAAKAAELRSLRYQVNPHFLFNALNSLSSLVMTGKGERAEEMIQELSNFYRHSLADEATVDVELGEEFALQQHYLAVEQVRFPSRLKVAIDLPPALEQVRVPGMILQPLVENSVKYAVAPVNRPVTITLSARAEYGRLVLTVSDDGPGAPKGATSGFGIGLANVRDRIQARFGGDAIIESGPVPGGYRTELRLPVVTHA